MFIATVAVYLKNPLENGKRASSYSMLKYKIASPSINARGYMANLERNIRGRKEFCDIYVRIVLRLSA